MLSSELLLLPGEGGEGQKLLKNMAFQSLFTNLLFR